MTEQKAIDFVRPAVLDFAKKSYSRAVYAVARLGLPRDEWPHADPCPADVDHYMRVWHEASRRRGSALAPEEAREEARELGLLP